MSNDSASDPAFDDALAFVLRHEGSRLTDDPADPGGATKYGISLRFLKSVGHLDGIDLDIDGDGDIDEVDIAALTAEQAGAILKAAFWDRYGYGAIKDAAVRAKLFDLAVNAGPGTAARLLQRALHACWFPPVEDGIFGPQTRSKANAAEPRALLAALKSEAAGFYRTLAAVRPKLGVYLGGWLNRAYD